MKIYLKFSALICLIALNATDARAQYDPMFTQYMFNEVFINPAYTGSHEALSLSALNRAQWVGIEGAPVTQTFVAHTPLFNKKVGVGLAAITEKIGVTQRTGVSFNYAYRILMPKGTFAFGLQAGIQSFREMLTSVRTTQDQDNEFSYNPTRFYSPNFGFGMYYSTPKWYAGLSVPRLVQTQVNNVGSGVVSRVNIDDFHYYSSIGYVFDINENIKLKPSVMAKIVLGAPMEADFTLTSLINNVLWVGASYRTRDAVSGILGYQVSPQFRVSYSYDYTITILQRYNSGSHEIQLSYLFNFKKEKIVTPRLF